MTGNLDRTSAKILVLGDSGVGKSSLIHLICHSNTLNSAQWTIGCSIDIKLYDNHYLEFWDIGGSRTHKIARRFLYQDYHGIILVFDSTNKKSRMNLNEWLLEVSHKTNDKDLDYYTSISVPVMTIGTKRDMLSHHNMIESEMESIVTSDPSKSNSSVVDFDESMSVETSTGSAPTAGFYQQPRANTNNSYLYRRLHTSDYSMSSSSVSFANSFHSMPAQSSTDTYAGSEFSLGNQQSVIYINTQDVLSFNPGSENQVKLNNFFKSVIERRNNRFYI